MELKDFMDLSKLQKIQDDFSNATGLAANIRVVHPKGIDAA